MRRIGRVWGFVRSSVRVSGVRSEGEFTVL